MEPQEKTIVLPVDQYGINEHLRAVAVDADQMTAGASATTATATAATAAAAAVLRTIVLGVLPVEHLVDDGQTVGRLERHRPVRALAHDVRYRFRLVRDDQRGRAARGRGGGGRRRLHEHHVGPGHHGHLPFRAIGRGAVQPPGRAVREPEQSARARSRRLLEYRQRIDLGNTLKFNEKLFIF